MLALIAPVLVVFCAGWRLESYLDKKGETAMRNAQHVMNANVLDEDVATVIDKRLESNQPKVVIIGNSKANTDIHPGALAKHLGLPRHKVQMFSIPNSIGPHWYAILKNRIYNNGHRPALVLIVSHLQGMLEVEPTSEAIYLNLAVHLTENEPVIEAKTFGNRTVDNYAWRKIRQNRELFRKDIMLTARNVGVGLTFGHQAKVRGGVYARGEDVADHAVNQIWKKGAVDLGLHNTKTMPVVDTTKHMGFESDPSFLPSAEASYIPDIGALAAKYGSRLAFVRPPLSPKIPEANADRLAPGEYPTVVAAIEATGGIFLDLEEAGLQARHFKDMVHMTDDGRRVFTNELGAHLHSRGALSPEPGWRPFIPRVNHDVVVERGAAARGAGGAGRASIACGAGVARSARGAGGAGGTRRAGVAGGAGVSCRAGRSRGTGLSARARRAHVARGARGSWLSLSAGIAHRPGLPVGATHRAHPDTSQSPTRQLSFHRFPFPKTIGTLHWISRGAPSP